MSRRSTTPFLVAALLLAAGLAAVTAGAATAGTGVAPAGGPTADVATADAATSDAGLATATQDGGEQTGGAERTVPCDYASLYDRTIDSVVAVQAGGLGSGFVYRAAGNESAANASVGAEADGAVATAGNESAAGTDSAVADDNGTYVVTNAHVVGDAETVAVQFARGDSRSGTVVGTDVGVDLAVVRVDEPPAYAGPLPVAEQRPRVGTGVAAIGSPFGLEQTITHGIVSGVNRSMPTRQGFQIPDVVQTDAAINPGNSGGPLVVCGGDVVGVNTAGISAQRAENVGFAVSASTVRQVVPVLLERGEYEHSHLGVQTLPAGPALLAANQANATGGVYVHRTAEGGPASDALEGTDGYRIVDGQRVPVGGDVIVGIDGQPVSSGEALSSHLLSETRPGDTVTLAVVRDGESVSLEVTLGERPEPEQATGSPQQPPG